MEFPILVPRPSLLTTTLVKDSKEEWAVVQSAVLNRIVQLRYLKTSESEEADAGAPYVTYPRRIKLFLRNVTEVLE